MFAEEQLLQIALFVGIPIFGALASYHNFASRHREYPFSKIILSAIGGLCVSAAVAAYLLSSQGWSTKNLGIALAATIAINFIGPVEAVKWMRHATTKIFEGPK